MARRQVDDQAAAQKQLAWLEEMERIEQEVFHARPRSEVVVPCTCYEAGRNPQCPIHGSFAGDPTGGNSGY